MTTQTEALKLAIDAKMDDVLRKAIVRSGKVITPPQPKKSEQEPVAWMRKDETCTDCFVWERTDEHTIPLYTTPPQRTWVGLTDEEMQDLWDRYAHMEMMRAIETKLKAKNERKEKNNVSR